MEMTEEARAFLRQVRDLDRPDPLSRFRVKSRLSASIAGAGVSLTGSVAAAGVAGGRHVVAFTVMKFVALGAVLGGGASTVLYSVAAPVRSAPATSASEAGQRSHRSNVKDKRLIESAQASIVDTSAAETPGSANGSAATSAGVNSLSSTAGSSAGEMRGSHATSSAPNPGEGGGGFSSVVPPNTTEVISPRLGAESSLSSDLATLAAAHRAIDAGDFNEALTILDRSKSSAAFIAEFMGTRVLALCSAGLSIHGAKLKDDFLIKYDGTPLAGRVRAACKTNIPGH